MKITYNKKVYKISSKKEEIVERSTSISSIVEDYCCGYGIGELESVSQRVSNSIKLSEKIVDMLYEKGIFNNSDITQILDCFGGLDSNIDVEILKMEVE